MSKEINVVRHGCRQQSQASQKKLLRENGVRQNVILVEQSWLRQTVVWSAGVQVRISRIEELESSQRIFLSVFDIKELVQLGDREDLIDFWSNGTEAELAFGVLDLLLHGD